MSQPMAIPFFGLEILLVLSLEIGQYYSSGVPSS